jgi:predicted Zn-dependent protease
VRRFLMCALLSVACVAPLAAQKDAVKIPKRPKMDAAADTNDPKAYYDYGWLQRTPWDKSMDAFYWAYRLAPDVTDYLLAVEVALWQKQSPEWRSEYFDGAEFVVTSKEAKQIDSLLTFVYRMEPFAHLYGPCVLEEGVDQITDPMLAGVIYEGDGCYRQAAEKYGQVLAKNPKRYSLHLNRAQAFFYLQQYGNTITELNIVLDSMRARDQKKIQFYYQSKQFLEAMLGTAYARNGDMASAREAYGRALTEDLSFYSAHAQLSALALADGDIDQALQEIDQAVQLKPDLCVLRVQYGDILLRTEPPRFADAEVQYRKAIELEPYFAKPYYSLALSLEGQGKNAEALQNYRAYLTRVPRRQVKMQQSAQARIAKLEALAASKP